MTDPRSAALWLDDTLAAAGTSLADPVEQIFAKTDALAQTTAPDTRRSGKTLVLLEAVCVMLPVVWLLRIPLQLPPIVAALAGLASPLLIVVFFWWLRWRSMGRLWSRARLVAECCRSLIATRATPSQPAKTLLSVVPALQSLLDRFAAQPVPAGWRDTYLRERIDDQLGYYRRQRDRALSERRALTRWSTILMDVALAVGVAGMIVTLHPRSASWLNLLGGSWLDFALGMAGLALPLGLLVAQSLRLVGDSTRRTARYTQQIQQLEHARERLAAAGHEAALPLLHEAEDAVLSEVLDWYFQAETTEDFYTIREASAVKVPGQAPPRSRARFNWLWRALGGLSTAGGFAVRVVLGRVVWIVLAVAFVLMWVSLKQTETPEVASRLQELGRMVNPPDGSVFVPQPIAATHGTIVLMHGMRDGWRPQRVDWTHWSAEMTANLRRRLGANMPQILFLDWKQGATASVQHGFNTQDPATRFLADLGGIRTSAQSTADFFGIRLVRMVENGQIRSDRPLHLIGHSAGGFMAARTAHILVAMGFPRAQLHVTVLDTPFPDAEVLHLPDYAASEFYRSSRMVSIDPATLDPRLHYRYIEPPPPPADVTGFRALMHEHSHAWKWFRDSIVSAKCGDEGFGRSPFCE